MLRRTELFSFRSRARCRRSAFTLLELILVMVIAATVLALAAPSLTNWSHGQKLRTAAEDLVALTHYARAQAVMSGTVYRVQLGTAGTFSLFKQQGTDFVQTHDAQGQAVTVPDGGKVELSHTVTNTSEQTTPLDGDTSDPSKVLDFDPTGRSPTATIKMYDSAGKSMTIENTSPLQQFHLVFSS